ncbi:MAG TPA: permease [Conexibacter sp.]|nr:permease [Conexibacter sp.]
MHDAISKLGEGLAHAGLMAWEVWWALVLGFAISAIVQAWVPRERIQAALAGEGLSPVARATGLGAASSSCSYAAIAIARSLFAKGASVAAALAFQFASTNLVWELGLVLWVLLGWQFTLGEYVGGIVMIGLMWALLRLFVSRAVERGAREHVAAAEHAGGHGAHCHHHDHEQGAPAAQPGWREQARSLDAWADVARNFRADWLMLWKEIALGFVLAGFVSLLGQDVFNGLFLHDAPAGVRTVWAALIGPLIAVASFVCSIGNVPLAAVLWAGGIPFAGVMAFIFADLIVLPIVLAYRKYYGAAFALRITALMFVTMALAAIAVDVLFGALGLIPSERPSQGDVFGAIEPNYKLVLNALATVAFAALLALTRRRAPAAVSAPAR